MRIKDQIQNIDYDDTKNFFKQRAHKYNTVNPYAVTMYQDDNAELVQKRNKYETEKLKRLLCLDHKSTVLDVACGIGRWADALNGKFKTYLGIDFSEELIRIAKERNTEQNVDFAVGSVTVLNQLLHENQLFNRILIIGILMYLNDEDVLSVMEQLIKHCEHNAIICIREPIGIEHRLTLKNYYSEELKNNYNAIYRTYDELIRLITPALLHNGFYISSEGYLFDEGLNNRKETSQYYMVLKRENGRD